MNRVSQSLVLVLSMFTSAAASAACPAVLDHDMRKLRSKDTVNLCEAYSGQPLLVINTASHCGYTPQFKGLEALYQEYKDRGLHVAGFPPTPSARRPKPRRRPRPCATSTTA